MKKKTYSGYHEASKEITDFYYYSHSWWNWYHLSGSAPCNFLCFRWSVGCSSSPAVMCCSHTAMEAPARTRSFFPSLSIGCRLLSQMSPDTDLWADPELLYFNKADTQGCQSRTKCCDKGTTFWAWCRMTSTAKPGCLLELCRGAVFQNVLGALVVNEQPSNLSRKWCFPRNGCSILWTLQGTGIDGYRYVTDMVLS